MAPANAQNFSSVTLSLLSSLKPPSHPILLLHSHKFPVIPSLYSSCPWPVMKNRPETFSKYCAVQIHLLWTRKCTEFTEAELTKHVMVLITHLLYIPHQLITGIYVPLVIVPFPDLSIHLLYTPAYPTLSSTNSLIFTVCNSNPLEHFFPISNVSLNSDLWLFAPLHPLST